MSRSACTPPRKIALIVLKEARGEQEWLPEQFVFVFVHIRGWDVGDDHLHVQLVHHRHLQMTIMPPGLSTKRRAPRVKCSQRGQPRPLTTISALLLRPRP